MEVKEFRDPGPDSPPDYRISSETDPKGHSLINGNLVSIAFCGQLNEPVPDQVLWETKDSLRLLFENNPGGLKETISIWRQDEKRKKWIDPALRKVGFDPDTLQELAEE